ncbi:MAG: hypothetical protein H7Y43_08515 [Akkermansiaceae bacterium]|nr:hypothetical protein [Verrucomicrobiales bacterium]
MKNAAIDDQPQQVQTSIRLNFLNTRCKAKLLRLVSAKQPRSKSRFMSRLHDFETADWDYEPIRRRAGFPACRFTRLSILVNPTTRETRHWKVP